MLPKAYRLLLQISVFQQLGVFRMIFYNMFFFQQDALAEEDEL